VLLVSCGPASHFSSACKWADRSETPFVDARLARPRMYPSLFYLCAFASLRDIFFVFCAFSRLFTCLRKDRTRDSVRVWYEDPDLLRCHQAPVYAELPS
jgi:hypothetical protein